MKKAIALISAAALMLMAGCSDEQTNGFSSHATMPMEVFSMPEELAFEANYIRLGELGNVNPPDSGYFPYCQVITSYSDLQSFIESEKQSLDFENGFGSGDLSFISFAEKYNEDFFYEKVLFVVMQMEGSGSVRHEVTDVLQIENNITVCIEKSAPEAMTEDIAYWAIVVEAPVDDYGGGPAAAQFSFEGDENSSLADEMPMSDRLDFSAEYHNGFLKEYGEDIPEPFIITSAGEFKKHFGTSGDELGYDKDFFKDNVLIAVPREEPSGSIYHEVTDVIKADDKISVSISSVTPEVCTDDIAEWTIFIGIPAENYNNEAVDVQFNTVEEE